MKSSGIAGNRPSGVVTCLQGVRHHKETCGTVRIEEFNSHNLKVIGSNPIPATKFGFHRIRYENGPLDAGRFCFQDDEAMAR